jgi:hypothetical protein
MFYVIESSGCVVTEDAVRQVAIVKARSIVALTIAAEGDRLN